MTKGTSGSPGSKTPSSPSGNKQINLFFDVSQTETESESENQLLKTWPKDGFPTPETLAIPKKVPDQVFGSLDDYDDDETIIGSIHESSLDHASERTLLINSELASQKKIWQPPQQRFLTIFPNSAERFFEKFDNNIISSCQFYRNKFLTYLAVALTGMVALEVGIAIPFILFVTGQDGLATELSYLILITCLFSQIPKRFMWRFRPYMAERAAKIRRKETAKTSSFPSRAVTCAVVYSYVIIYSYLYAMSEDHSVRLEWWMPFLFIISTLMVSWARIYLGVHYPSDCLIGMCQGIIVCVLGTGLWRADVLGCSSCFENECYTDDDSSKVIDSHLRNINPVVFVVSVTVMFLLSAISVMKPIDFWIKCDRVYGMLFPGIVFQLTFLCPNSSAGSLSAPHEKWYSVFYAFGCVLLATLIGYRNDGKRPLIVFSALFVLLYGGLVLWRLLV